MTTTPSFLSGNWMELSIHAIPKYDKRQDSFTAVLDIRPGVFDSPSTNIDALSLIPKFTPYTLVSDANVQAVYDNYVTALNAAQLNLSSALSAAEWAYSSYQYFRDLADYYYESYISSGEQYFYDLYVYNSEQANLALAEYYNQLNIANQAQSEINSLTPLVNYWLTVVSLSLIVSATIENSNLPFTPNGCLFNRLSHDSPIAMSGSTADFIRLTSVNTVATTNIITTSFTGYGGLFTSLLNAPSVKTVTCENNAVTVNCEVLKNAYVYMEGGGSVGEISCPEIFIGGEYDGNLPGHVPPTFYTSITVGGEVYTLVQDDTYCSGYYFKKA